MPDASAANSLAALGGLLSLHVALSAVSVAAAAGLAALIVGVALRVRRLYRRISGASPGAVAPLLALSYLIAASLFFPDRAASPGPFPSPFAFSVLMLALCPGILLARSAILAIEAADKIHGETATALALTPIQRRLLVMLPQVWPAILDAMRIVGSWVICAATLSPLIGQPSLGQAMVLRRLPADGLAALGAWILLGAVLWAWNAVLEHLRSKAIRR